MTVSSPRVEKQRVALTGQQSIILLNGPGSKMYFGHLKEDTPKTMYISALHCHQMAWTAAAAQG